MKYILLIICLTVPVCGFVYCIYHLLFSFKKLKRFKVVYPVSCGWGVMSEEFICSAYSKREAHKLFVAAEIHKSYGSYGDPEILANFRHMEEDIHEIEKESL